MKACVSFESNFSPSSYIGMVRDPSFKDFMRARQTIQNLKRDSLRPRHEKKTDSKLAWTCRVWWTEGRANPPISPYTSIPADPAAQMHQGLSGSFRLKRNVAHIESYIHIRGVATPLQQRVVSGAWVVPMQLV